VAKAYSVAEDFRAAGIAAETIEANTVDRSEILSRFRDGVTRLLVNVYVLTEGVDIPDASVCILARGVSFVGAYLQMVGRILRPAPGKVDGLLLDLPGVSHAFGNPCDDRLFSLGGAGISQPKPTPVITCPQCGVTYEAGPEECPECGFEPTIRKAAVRIWNLELLEVFNGELTPNCAKLKEYQRLMKLAQERDFSIGWVFKEYTKLFGSKPQGITFSKDDKIKEFRRLATFARAKGFAPGWVAHRYREVFGVWPRGVE
jgi:hypothetical protein